MLRLDQWLWNENNPQEKDCKDGRRWRFWLKVKNLDHHTQSIACCRWT